ncbi:MAG: alpha/beta hydrolase [Planctomycetes bacterium]|nr:alpha/beta hydrolase [Planctomycetota bacterium]
MVTQEIVGYRGYGRSTGTPGEDGLYADAEAAWRYLTETRGERPDRIVLFGRSLGGAVAIELARRHNPAALVVESTFTSLVDVGRHHYPLLPVSLIATHRFDSLSKIAGIACPKLFLHGTDDALIPIDLGRALYDAAQSPKRFLETPGGHNNSGFTYSSEYTQLMTDFVNGAVSSPAP